MQSKVTLDNTGGCKIKFNNILIKAFNCFTFFPCDNVKKNIQSLKKYLVEYENVQLPKSSYIHLKSWISSTSEILTSISSVFAMEFSENVGFFSAMDKAPPADRSFSRGVWGYAAPEHFLKLHCK